MLECSKLARTGTFVAAWPLSRLTRSVNCRVHPGFDPTAVGQRLWRDVHFAAAHITMNKCGTYGPTGRMILDVSEKSLGVCF